MELKYLVIADSIQQGSNDGINSINVLIDPKASIQVPFLPTTHSFSVFCAINGLPSKSGNFKLSIFYKDKEEEEVFSPVIGIGKEQLEEMSKQGQDLFLSIVLQNITLRREGYLVLRLLYNEEPIGEESYRVEVQNNN